MDLNTFTQMSRQAVTDAQAIARRLNHHEVDTWHLLSALLAQESGLVPGLVDKLGLTASALALGSPKSIRISVGCEVYKVWITNRKNTI